MVWWCSSYSDPQETDQPHKEMHLNTPRSVSLPSRARTFCLVLDESFDLILPLDCQEIQAVYPKGIQSWIFIGRTDAEAETPILWPPNESVLHIRWPKYWSFSISPSNEYSGLNSFRMDWFNLLAVQGTLFSNPIVQKQKFFSTQLSLWSNSHIHTWLLEKP